MTLYRKRENDTSLVRECSSRIQLRFKADDKKNQRKLTHPSCCCKYVFFFLVSCVALSPQRKWGRSEIDELRIDSSDSSDSQRTSGKGRTSTCSRVGASPKSCKYPSISADSTVAAMGVRDPCTALKRAGICSWWCDDAGAGGDDAVETSSKRVQRTYCATDAQSSKAM